jgi:REP element-mobilizing transposase RayT
MDEIESLSHTQWDCKYHIVFIPKWRRKVLYGALRKHLGEMFRRLAEQRESRVEEGHLMPDHVHMMLRIPPKYAVAQVVGYIKGKSAIHIGPVELAVTARRLEAANDWPLVSGPQTSRFERLTSLIPPALPGDP